MPRKKESDVALLQEAAEMPPASPTIASERPVFRERLPAGSRKTLVWTGVVWVGELVVPGCPVFTRQANSEMKCAHDLHALYKRHVAELDNGSA